MRQNEGKPFSDSRRRRGATGLLAPTRNKGERPSTMQKGTRRGKKATTKRKQWKQGGGFRPLRDKKSALRLAYSFSSLNFAVQRAP